MGTVHIGHRGDDVWILCSKAPQERPEPRMLEERWLEFSEALGEDLSRIARRTHGLRA